MQMKNNKTQIFLICSTAKDKLEDAIFLQEQIMKEGYPLKWCIVNRAYHQELDFSKEKDTFKDPRERELYNYFVGRKERSVDSIRHLAKKSCFKETRFIVLPEFEMATEDQASLMALAADVEKFWLNIHEE